MASRGVRSLAFSVFGERLCSMGLPGTVVRRVRAGLALAARSSRSIRSASWCRIRVRPSPRSSAAAARSPRLPAARRLRQGTGPSRRRAGHRPRPGRRAAARCHVDAGAPAQARRHLADGSQSTGFALACAAEEAADPGQAAALDPTASSELISTLRASSGTPSPAFSPPGRRAGSGRLLQGWSPSTLPPESRRSWSSLARPRWRPSSRRPTSPGTRRKLTAECPEHARQLAPGVGQRRRSRRALPEAIFCLSVSGRRVRSRAVTAAPVLS